MRVFRRITGIGKSHRKIFGKEPSADSAILAGFSSLRILIKQHIENFYDHSHQMQLIRHRIAKHILDNVVFGDGQNTESFLNDFFDSLIHDFPPREGMSGRAQNHLRYLFESGAALRRQLQSQNATWEHGRWYYEDSPVAFPSIWKNNVMLREWEVYDR